VRRVYAWRNIPYFATQYHSEEWRKNRSAEQRIYAVFGEKTPLAKIIFRLRGTARRVKKSGFFAALGYYAGRFILRNRAKKDID
jgi:hypothetical protein